MGAALASGDRGGRRGSGPGKASDPVWKELLPGASRGCTCPRPRAPRADPEAQALALAGRHPAPELIHALSSFLPDAPTAWSPSFRCPASCRQGS